MFETEVTVSAKEWIRLNKIEAKYNTFKKALEHIANPIQHLQKEALKEKKKLDGSVAIKLSGNPCYLKLIAEDALRGDK